ncbi:MAG TPA: ATP-dependent zinc metalloprotease FtsH [Alphaproteobacteria bacterium]|nr:ATP-dependent zinc metalloprotease FtsH [Alphaproteobacteria bacterium]
MDKDKKFQFNIWYFLLAMLGIMFLGQLWSQQQAVQTIPYSQFEQQLHDGEISKVTVTETRIHGTYKKAEKNGQKQFVTMRVQPSLAEDFSKYGVQVTGGTDNTWFTQLLSWILPFALIFGLWIFFFRGMMGKQGLGGGFMSIGKSKAKVYLETDTKVTFNDVAGVDEAKEELEEIVSFLKEPEEHGKLGARIPKGILLVGPPGTGKTLLARAVAGEAGVPFFSISGSEFVEMFVGVGAARVRDLFEQARQKAPAIIFIDELDALGRARGLNPMGGGHDEKEQTLNQLLAELDGFDPSTGLVLLAATNRPEILDPALLRAGRFDRQVLVDRPDRLGRAEILKVHLNKAKISTDVEPDKIAAMTPGFTGADLANLVNEAALLATRRKGSDVTMADFSSAIERIVAGLEKKHRILSEKERRVIAHHELGHTIVALSIKGVDPVHKVSIIPRGVGALGYTIQRPTEDRYLMTRKELEDKMAVLLGGRASEKLIFDHLSTGAADDLAKASDIARSMVTRYGMVESLGNVTFDRDRPHFLDTGMASPYSERNYSEDTAREIDCAIREIVDKAYDQAYAILERNRDLLERSAKDLLETETLEEPALKKIKEQLAPMPDENTPRLQRRTG